MTTRNATSLLNVKPPQIWLAYDSSNSGYTKQLPDVTPWLVASWQLIPGLHLEAETTLAKRKFIVSPFLRDTVAGAKPVSNPWLSGRCVCIHTIDLIIIDL